MPKSRDPWWQFRVPESPPPEFVTPECFTDDEWAAYYHAEKQAVWSTKSLPDAIRKDMCEDCTLSYQRTQVVAGRCHPYFGVSTPAHRAALLVAGEEDPNVKPRKSRAEPWSDDES